MLNVMVMAKATPDTWMGSEDVSKLNVLVEVAMIVGLSGTCMYRSESPVVLMNDGLKTKAIGKYLHDK